MSTGEAAHPGVASMVNCILRKEILLMSSACALKSLWNFKLHTSLDGPSAGHYIFPAPD